MTTAKTSDRPSQAELRKTHTGPAVKAGDSRVGLSGNTVPVTYAQALAGYLLDQPALAKNATSGLVTFN